MIFINTMFYVVQMQEWDSHEDFSLVEIPWPETDTSKIRLLPPDQPSFKNRLLKVI